MILIIVIDSNQHEMNRFEHSSLRDKVALCHLSEVETIPKDSNKIQ